MDVITYALCKRYVDNTAASLGAIKGAPCTIDSIIDTGDAHVITFGWTGTDGTKQTSSITLPHGLSAENKEELEVNLKDYIDAQIDLATPEKIDDGEI